MTPFHSFHSLIVAVLLLSIFVVLQVNTAKMVSFTANGRWGPQTAISNDTLCQQKFMCTPNNWTWIPSYPVPPFVGGLYDNETACAALLLKGITSIYFHGDSYMRQVYAAMMITLTGDYRGGSLANATRVPECTNHKQFNEKRCGTRELNHYGRVCGGKVILDPLLNGFADLSLCGSSNGSIVLWSFGNYKVSKGVRFGVNNASAYAELFEGGICKILNGESFINKTRHSTLPIAQVGDEFCLSFDLYNHYVYLPLTLTTFLFLLLHHNYPPLIITAFLQCLLVIDALSYACMESR